MEATTSHEPAAEPETAEAFVIVLSRPTMDRAGEPILTESVLLREEELERVAAASEEGLQRIPTASDALDEPAGAATTAGPRVLVAAELSYELETSAANGAGKVRYADYGWLQLLQERNPELGTAAAGAAGRRSWLCLTRCNDKFKERFNHGNEEIVSFELVDCTISDPKNRRFWPNFRFQARVDAVSEQLRREMHPLTPPKRKLTVGFRSEPELLQFKRAMLTQLREASSNNPWNDEQQPGAQEQHQEEEDDEEVEHAISRSSAVDEIDAILAGLGVEDTDFDVCAVGKTSAIIRTESALLREDQADQADPSFEAASAGAQPATPMDRAASLAIDLDLDANLVELPPTEAASGDGYSGSELQG